MSVRIEVTQIRSVIYGPRYQVKTQVTYVAGIDRNIFVFNTETDEFMHVATTWDMENYLAGKTASEDADKNYYRGDVVVVDFPTETLGLEAALYTIGRIGYLARAYETMTELFIGSENHVFIGS